MTGAHLLADAAPSTPRLAQSTIGQSRRLGQMLGQMRQAQWAEVKTSAATVYGIGSLALAELRAEGSARGSSAVGDHAATSYSQAFAKLDSQDRQKFVDRLTAQVGTSGHQGDFLPALLKLLSSGDATDLITLYQGPPSEPGSAEPRLFVLASAIGMASAGARASFWASFNLAYAAADPAQDPQSCLADLTSCVGTHGDAVHDHGVSVHTAAGRGDSRTLDGACDQFAAMGPRVSASLATALGRSMRVVDEQRASGRDNSTLRGIQATGAMGLLVAHQIFTGQVASYLLQAQLDGSWESTASARLLAQARRAPSITPPLDEPVVTSLPDPATDPDGTVRIEGRVTAMAATRLGKKLVTNFSVAVGGKHPEIPCLAEFHDLGHEGLTLGAYASVRGKVMDQAGTRTLRVGRVSLSEPLRDGWLNAWFALAKPWAELSPGALDIQWSPGRGEPVTEETEKSGVGAGEVIFNKPVPPKGF